MTTKKPSVTLELIAQQNNELADKLTGYYEEILKCSSGREAQASAARAAIVDYLQKRVGIKIDLILNTTNPPMCMPVMTNTRHVLSTIMFDDAYDEQTDDFEKAIKNSTIKKGTIDLKNGKLGGIYSTISCPVWMGFEFCKQHLTARECVAVLMHEIGHLFLAFEMMYRTIRTSQVLASLHQVRTGRDSSMTYEHALELAGKELLGDNKEFIECVTMKDDTAVCTVVFSRVYRKLATDFGENSVAGVNFEVLSDNFSAKWGLAKDLTSALVVFYGESGVGRVVGVQAFIMYLAPLIGGFWPVVALSALGASFGVMLVSSIVMVVLTLMLSGRGDLSWGAQQSNVYDKPFVSFQRIRETVIQQLKYLDLDAINRKRLLDELKIIDTHLKGGREIADIFDDIGRLFTSNRRAEFAFKLERDIELLANNNLFVSAQRLALKA